MKRITQVACILLMTVGLASIAHAQLASYVDDRGTVVFINADPPRGALAKPAKAGDSAAANGAAKEAALGAISAPKDAAPAKPELPVSPGTQPSAAAAGSAAIAAGPTQPAPATIASTGGAENAPTALQQMVEETAERNHVDPALVRAVISTESNWNSSAVSSKGAQGLMQLIPETAHSLGVGNAFDPRQNIDAGVRYLSTLLSRYNGDLSKALAAYNAGPGAVDRFGGVPNYRETREYVRKVTSTYMRPESARQPRAYDAPAPIYRTRDESGRVIFVNE